MTIQLIEKQGAILRVKINGIVHEWSGVNLYRGSFLPLKPKVKGSTLGWNTIGGFVSYWQLKKAISLSVAQPK
jgi:hypothetical protein